MKIVAVVSGGSGDGGGSRGSGSSRRGGRSNSINFPLFLTFLFIVSL